MIVLRLFWLCLAVWCIGAPLGRADTVSVAVASNFTAPMRDIALAFQSVTGHEARLSFGSSGKFFAQIQNGAPFDVFFSADQAKPEALEQAQLALPDSRFTYAIGALVLWSSQPDYVGDGESRLREGEFRKLALANPRLAPYGMAAMEVLQALGLIKATQSRWVQGENIAQTYQFVRSGNADLGFVALSQVMAEGKVSSGSSWVVPAPMYQPIRQDAVLLRRGKDNAAALALLEFVRGDQAREIMMGYGYTAPMVP